MLLIKSSTRLDSIRSVLTQSEENLQNDQRKNKDNKESIYAFHPNSSKVVCDGNDHHLSIGKTCKNIFLQIERKFRLHNRTIFLRS